MSGPALAPALNLEPARSGDLVTLSFADSQAGVYGQARVALLPDGRRRALVTVFQGATAIVADAVPDGVLELSAGARGRWSARFDGAEDGEGAFGLELQAAGPAAMLGDPQNGADDDASAQQPGSVTGSVRVGGRDIALAGSGQVGLVRGAADWAQRELWREIDCWLEEDERLTVRASRPAGAGEHGAELTGAVLVAGEPPVAAPIDEARLSTVYGQDGRPRRAGLELWPSADSDYPRRIAGHALCAGTVVISAAGGQADLLWHCAFLQWHMEGEEGVGPYSIVRTQSG